MFAALASAGVGCLAPAPGGTTSSDPTSTPTETDTDPDSVDVHLQVWDESNARWNWETHSLDAVYWSYFASSCDVQAGNAPYLPYSTADGLCIKVWGGLGLPGEEWAEMHRDDCTVVDPWVLECAALPGCCETLGPPRDTG